MNAKKKKIKAIWATKRVINLKYVLIKQTVVLIRSRCKVEQCQACSKKDRGVQKPDQMYDPATQHSKSNFAATY